MAKEETTTTTCTCGGRCICNSKHRVLYALGGLVILGLLLGTVFEIINIFLNCKLYFE
jgi:hypothetical protein